MIPISQSKHFNEQFRERTMKMAADVRNLLAPIQINPIDQAVVQQLIRSSSSVAANYRAATRSRSDAEFYAKICIVVEETDETLFWVEYLSLIRVFSNAESQPLLSELDQMVRMFATIKKTMKEKLGK
jgi:four helix bundle protein